MRKEGSAISTKTTAKSSRDLAVEVTFLTCALKAPTLRESVARLAERARAESWTHEEYLVACLQREVSARPELTKLARIPLLVVDESALQRPPCPVVESTIDSTSHSPLGRRSQTVSASV